MVKPNIREETANKLLPMKMLLGGIVDGNATPKLAPVALKGILAAHNWLKKGNRKFPKSSVRYTAIEKLISLEITCSKIIKGTTVSSADADLNLKDINEIIAWLDKREYKTGNK